MACEAAGGAHIMMSYVESSLKPEDHEARHFSFDVVLGASGKAVNLEGFKR